MTRGVGVGATRPPHWQSQELVAFQASVGQARPGLLEGTLHASSWGAPPHPGFRTVCTSPHSPGSPSSRSSCLGLPPASRVPQPGHTAAPRF